MLLGKGRRVQDHTLKTKQARQHRHRRKPPNVDRAWLAKKGTKQKRGHAQTKRSENENDKSREMLDEEQNLVACFANTSEKRGKKATNDGGKTHTPLLIIDQNLHLGEQLLLKNT